MKINTSAESAMVVVIDGYPDMRFTPSGRAVCAFVGKTTGRLYFRQWENDKRPTEYERDTGEYEGTAAKLTELPADAEIIVIGRCEIERHKTQDGTTVQRNVFTVRDWSYDGWPWKVKDQPLGLVDNVIA